MTLGGQRSWTATFDSYDQYREVCYYLATLFDGATASAPFMVKVGLDFAGDDWTTPKFVDELRVRLAAVAATGQTNTDYAR
jgi:hypothetical protein